MGSGEVIAFLVFCLEDCDGQVNQCPANALQKICQNGKDIAKKVINKGAIDPLCLCLQEPDIKLKRHAGLTMSNIAKHSKAHTRKLRDEKDTLGSILHYHQTKEAMFRRQVLLCLSYIAQYSSDKEAQIINLFNNQLLEENIAGGDKSVTTADKTKEKKREKDPTCQQNALSLLYYIVKHGPGHTSQVSAKIRCETLKCFLEDNSNSDRDMGLQVKATLAQYSKEQAGKIKRLGGHKILGLCLKKSKLETISYGCTAINLIASDPNPRITNGLVDDIYIDVRGSLKVYIISSMLLELALNKNLPQSLTKNGREPLKNMIQNNTNLDALISLLEKPVFGGVNDNQYESILSFIERRIIKLLNENKNYNKVLIQNWIVKKLIKLKSQYKTLEDYIKAFF